MMATISPTKVTGDAGRLMGSRANSRVVITGARRHRGSWWSRNNGSFGKRGRGGLSVGSGKTEGIIAAWAKRVGLVST